MKDKNLTHRTSTVYDSAYFGEGSGRTWLDDVNCAGHESRLVDCSFSCWECEDCSHSEDVGVRCGMLSRSILLVSWNLHENMLFNIKRLSQWQITFLTSMIIFRGRNSHNDHRTRSNNRSCRGTLWWKWVKCHDTYWGIASYAVGSVMDMILCSRNFEQRPLKFKFLFLNMTLSHSIVSYQ